MFGDKSKISSLVAIVLAGYYSQQALAAPFPDVDSMLEAIRPNAAINAPELNSLIIALDALPTEQQKFDALQSLIPTADGGLRAASEGPMRQILSVLNDRLIKVTQESGISGGDETGNEAEKEAEKATEAVTEKAQTQSTQTDNAQSDSTQTVDSAKETSKIEQKSETVKEKVETLTQSKEKTNHHEHKSDAKTASVATDKKEADTKESEINTADEEASASAKADETPKEIVHGAWIQVLGSNIGQDIRGQIPGYDANVWGIVIGRDYLICPQLAVGAAMGYQHALVDQRNISGSSLDIKRFQGTLYAGYRFKCPFYLNGALTYAHNDYDNNRNILVPPVGGVPFVRISQADFDADEFNAYLETGYTWSRGNFRAIPKIMLMYSYYDFDHYFEKDAFGLNLYVRYHDMSFLPLGAGFKLEYQNEFEKAYVVPEIHAYAFHDFINDKQVATALFTGGGFEFLNQGVNAAKNSIEVGAGIAVHSYRNTAVVVQYDYAARSDYHRHQAFVKVRHEWA